MYPHFVKNRNTAQYNTFTVDMNSVTIDSMDSNITYNPYSRVEMNILVKKINKYIKELSGPVYQVTLCHVNGEFRYTGTLAANSRYHSIPMSTLRSAVKRLISISTDWVYFTSRGRQYKLQKQNGQSPFISI